MKRIMVNLDEPIAEIVERKAAEQRRSASSFIAVIIENDLRASGLLQPAGSVAIQELTAQVQAAAQENPAVIPAVRATLRRTLRQSAVA